MCKDFLQIADIGNKHMLFQNCTEMEMPLEILSESNKIQVIFSADMFDNNFIVFNEIFLF